MRTLRFLMVIGLLLTPGCAASSPGAGSGSPGAATAPDFAVQTFADGTFALSEQRGKVVVLNFFESW